MTRIIAGVLGDARAALIRMASTLSQRPVGHADNRFAKLEAKDMKADSRRTGVLAFKRGMMSHYDKWGYRHPVTVLDVPENQ